MSFTLYLRDDCHDCERVLEWLNATSIAIDIDDIDAPHDPLAPHLFAAPALCDGPRLLAYGMDIIRWFETHRKKVT